MNDTAISILLPAQATIADLLKQQQSLEAVAYLVGHSATRTTALYDRRHRKVTRNLVERISIPLGSEQDHETRPDAPAVSDEVT